MMGRDEVRETLSKADELVTELKAYRTLSPESGNVTSVRVEAGGAGVWIAATACLMALVSVWFEHQRMTDLRIDMQAERLSRENMDTWTAQEVTAIRSYITNGKLTPMGPRPTPNQEHK